MNKKETEYNNLILKLLKIIIIRTIQMETKELLFVDTSCKSTRYCYYELSPNDFNKEKFLRNKVESDFDVMIDSITKKISIFEGDYESIENAHSLIEYCGQGTLCKKICEENSIEFKNCFPTEQEIDNTIESLIGQPHELTILLDKVFNETLDKLNSFFLKHIDINKIIFEAKKNKLKKFRCHSNLIGYTRKC